MTAIYKNCSDVVTCLTDRELRLEIANTLYYDMVDIAGFI